MTRWLGLMVIAPVAVATAIAGTITNPARTRPCAVEYTKGIRGAPLHLVLGADGNLYTGESAASRILQFNPNTGATREFPVPGNLAMHDVISGPDGNIWWDALNSRFGKLDLATGQVTVYTLPAGTQPHDLAWSGGKLYIALLLPGELGVWDPTTGKLTQVSAGLPPGNQMHSLTPVPDGDIWATLSNGNAIARYSPQAGRFVQLVHMPIPNSGPRDMTYIARKHSLYFTLFASNRLVQYDLQTGKLTVYASPLPAITLKLAIALKPAEKLTFLRGDAQEQYLYSGTFQSEVIQFNLDTDKMKRIFCGITFPAATAGIAHDRKGREWFVEAFPGRLARLELK